MIILDSSLPRYPYDLLMLYSQRTRAFIRIPKEQYIITAFRKHSIKPIFHQNAKYLASGVGVGQCTRRQIFALPNAKYTNMLVYFGVTPDANPKICVTPDANPRRQPVEYRWRWAFWRWGWRWACTFHVVYVNFICVGHPTQTRFSVEYGL